MKKISLICLLLIIIIACNENQNLTVLTYEEMSLRMEKNLLKMESDIPYYDQQNKLIPKEEIPSYSDKLAYAAWYVDADNNLVKVAIQDVAAARTMHSKTVLIPDVKNLNCEDINDLMYRLYRRHTQNRDDDFLNIIVDEQNEKAMAVVLDKCGFPTQKTAGDNGMEAAWALLQKQDVDTRKKYFKDVINASENGWLTRAQVASMQDMILKDQNRPQLYGTQLVQDFDGTLNLYELRDQETVDLRRRTMGLIPLNEFVASFGLTFDVPQKSQMPVTE